MISEILKQCSTSTGTPVSPEDQQKNAYVTKPVDENVRLFTSKMNDLRDGVACQLTSLNQRLESADASRQRDDKTIHVLKENIRQLEEKLELSEGQRQKEYAVRAAELKSSDERVSSLLAQLEVAQATITRLRSELIKDEQEICSLRTNPTDAAEDENEDKSTSSGCVVFVLLIAVVIAAAWVINTYFPGN